MEVAQLARELAELLGERWVLTRRADLAAYAYDATCAKHMPDLVAFPGSTSEVAAAVRLARKYRVPVIARGAGTNLSGGTIAEEGGLILGMQRLNRILEIDPDSRRAVVEPGVRNIQLTEAVKPYGLFYAPDPSSQRASTIGGNCAENAGGPHCLKYGVTANHVCGMEVVLSDGTVAQLGGAAEDWPGYDLTGLTVGSEGTMAIITKVIVKLLPEPPAVATLLAIFTRLEDAVAAVSDIIAERVIPAAMELMDQVAVRVIQQSMDAGYPPGAEAVLVIEVDGLAAELQAQVARIRDSLARHGVVEIREATDEAERAALWLGRRSVGGAMARWSQFTWSQDVTVPRDRLSELIRRCLEIGAKYGLAVCTVAHAGDGNAHPTFPYDPSDPAQVEAICAANQETVAACVELGGAITGEHGVGLDKLPNVPLMFTPAEMATLAAVRDALNPGGLLNPGKKLPVRTAGF